MSSDILRLKKSFQLSGNREGTCVSYHGNQACFVSVFNENTKKGLAFFFLEKEKESLSKLGTLEEFFSLSSEKGSQIKIVGTEASCLFLTDFLKGKSLSIEKKIIRNQSF